MEVHYGLLVQLPARARAIRKLCPARDSALQALAPPPPDTWDTEDTAQAHNEYGVALDTFSL